MLLTILISGFRRDVDGICGFATPPYFFQNLRYRLSFPLGLLTREDATDTLFRNVGKQLPHDAA
jgi:hypothetical protein